MLVATPLPLPCPLLDVPAAHNLVEPRAHKKPAVGGEGDRLNGTRVTLECIRVVTVPESDRIVEIADRKKGRVRWREGDRGHAPFCPVLWLWPPGPRVPKLHEVVVAAARKAG